MTSEHLFNVFINFSRVKVFGKLVEEDHNCRMYWHHVRSFGPINTTGFNNSFDV